MNFKTTLKVALATAAMAMATGAAAQNYKPEYRMSLVVGTAFPWGQGGQIWADLVRERTNGRINIKLYPGVSLVNGDQTREFSAVRQGVIDMAIGSTINWSPQIKELNVFSLPFLATTWAQTDAMTGGEVGKQIFDIIEKRGAIPLAWGENGFRQLTNSKRIVSSPADMKGMKIRVVGSPLFIDAFTALGANPTQMSWADAQPALASGAVDGQENPLSIFVAAKMDKLGQKYITEWNYMNDPLVFVVNKDVWNSWTAADRDIVRQAAQDAAKQQIALARKPVKETILAMGVGITQLTPAQLAEFKKVTKPVYDKWVKQIGPSLVKKAEQAVANAK
ncbi:DctP family TRAP transporter solute-binding subunit [Orrella daihaiensis]|uniref:DctP family TRAP transporter solute-binding subunit n=1 Tax=Orrella daihaiensis TaxID=2782176 RepID=A0ABY4AJJ4_9BURK|nr:DctP family TRAP transporter solute-binding subunit [Orrella daihaiensis]UOD49222.1 DctP family TRAP transporter solute-binding subunit [Orrella daihaiensis]